MYINTSLNILVFGEKEVNRVVSVTAHGLKEKSFILQWEEDAYI